MNKSTFLVTIGKRDFYYNGKQYLFKKHLGKYRRSKLTPIKTKNFVNLLLRKGNF